LTLTTSEIRSPKRRQKYLAHLGDSHTLRSVKHPFAAGKLPVRGKFRIACMMIASAATANVRRIQRYRMAKIKQAEATKSPQAEAATAAVVSFFVSRMRWLRTRLVFSPNFGY